MMARLQATGRMGTRLRLPATRGFASATTTANPNVATDAECSEYYNNAAHYDVLWGKDTSTSATTRTS